MTTEDLFPCTAEVVFKWKEAQTNGSGFDKNVNDMIKIQESLERRLHLLKKQHFS